MVDSGLLILYKEDIDELFVNEMWSVCPEVRYEL